uniref:G-protein coupled receptors family 1 profile domain-containing protein n=1 Tax=Chinchilla lanigera TaxID=34839 RepID=A0A8C2W5C0_CHILA
MAGGNRTRISEFILMSFSALPTEIQSLLFLVFLIIYLVTLMGNSLIILVTLADPMLHSPMYFFLSIAAAILKIPSAKGKHKAFSTCSSHLLVVSLFYVSLSLTYFRPKSDNSPENKKLLSLSYTVVTPMLNPIIYSLRNNEVKNALSRTFHKALALRICIL